MPQVHQVLQGHLVFLASFLEVSLDQRGTGDIQAHLVMWVQEDHRDQMGYVFPGLKEIVVTLATLEAEAIPAHVALQVPQSLG